MRDIPLEEVFDALRSDPSFASNVGSALRTALDEVIDGPRTGRFKVDQLEKTEKTYIGTKVEIVLRAVLKLDRGNVLDNLIAGHEVDTKFTIKRDWMIPSEAVGHICMLVRADDKSGAFEVGLIRATPEVLRAGLNRDSKHSISADGRSKIRWLAQGTMPPNLMLGLTDEIRTHILSQPSGRQRMRALLMNVTGKLISREVLEQVAQQRDPMRRGREMKKELAALGYQILCATYKPDRAIMIANGFDPAKRNEWLSLRLSGGAGPRPVEPEH